MHSYSCAANSSVLKLWKNSATAEQQLRQRPEFGETTPVRHEARLLDTD